MRRNKNSITWFFLYRILYIIIEILISLCLPPYNDRICPNNIDNKNTFTPTIEYGIDNMAFIYT